ncbi:MAG: Nif3-like dinuclear metal center hexameric protein [Planctomycetota bacterium]
MRIADVVAHLERIAPPAYAESWDNVGLLVGDDARRCERVLLCIDLTEAVLAEAREAKAPLVMAYHPVIFKPLARVTPAAAPVVWAAVRANVGVYSVHTAYDMAVGGSNDALADALGMSDDRRPLRPRCAEGATKLVVFAPRTDLEAIQAAAFAAGAGCFGPTSEYAECGFHTAGTGTFFGSDAATPAVGRKGRREAVEEVRWETICPRRRLADALRAITDAHSYEEPAIDVLSLTDAPPGVGLGRVGALARPVALKTMLGRVRESCGVRRVLLAGPRERTVRTLAVGCGSCGSLFRDAIAAGADLYVTGELRHHDALAAAAAGLTVACVGHSNSERLTLAALERALRDALPGLEVVRSQADEDPFAIV